MDDLVQQAMAKWPNVPDCYGWLGLDSRGDWYMRDEKTQAQGPFSQSKGSRLVHERLIEFIARNYEADKQGNWYFQNGPQRVYVELEAAPWIWRIQADGAIESHTGVNVRVQRCLMDEYGHLYLDTEQGFGLVHTQDMWQASEMVEAGLWVPQEVLAQDLPKRFGYVQSPQQAQAKI